MNDNLNKARPRRPRITRFKSVDDFWRYHTDHPEAFSHMDFTGIAEMANKVRDRTGDKGGSTLQSDAPTSDRHPEPVEGAGRPEKNGKTPHSNPVQKNVPNGNKTASKNGKERERTGEYRVGPGNPPKEHQFQNGNPGGPGGPLGPRSMRKLIRTMLFDDETNGQFAAAVTSALFRQAFKGNTHAIRIICENGNNRRKRT